jgi:hypothetical protein
VTYAYVFIALLILGAGIVGWDLYRSLKTGEATLRMVTVSKSNDRTFFWIYVGGKFTGMAAMFYMAALILALAFPDSHVSIWPMTR